MKQTPSIDLFCHVVDNFGDIGVCWRLAKTLAEDHGSQVRLFVDDFKTFKRIERDLNPELVQQFLHGVDVLRWDDATIAAQFADDVPLGDCVIEAFACHLPPVVIERMKAAKPAPVWMDLEYLSAEDWVDNVHAIPSFHPETKLQKTLFFPGFTVKTGGLSREQSLMERRDAFQKDEAAQNRWRAEHGAPPLQPGVLDISLFCYDNAPLEDLVHGIAAANPGPVRFLIPDGVARPQQDRLAEALPPGVTLHVLPFLRQDDYDHLLWTCHLNFVRGEDSFVRAIWAGRPFIWQIYVQDEDAHLIKLRAFLERFSQNLTSQDAETLAQFTVMWNLGGHEGEADSVTRQFFAALPRLIPHARDRAQDLAGQPDLATQLIRFIQAQTP
jgi:uncharacterized repeat protein (TIGR03837 family)